MNKIVKLIKKHKADLVQRHQIRQTLRDQLAAKQARQLAALDKQVADLAIEILEAEAAIVDLND